MGRPKKFSREGVLEKALPLFWRYGFARTTLPDLEAETGVNKSGLYAEFESKEALFLACLDYYFAHRPGAAILSSQPLGWSNIQKFLEEAPSCSLDERGCFSVNSMREVSVLPEQARQIMLEGRNRLKRSLKQNIDAAKPKMDAGAVCEIISVFFSGLCIEANLDPDRRRSREKIGKLMQMLRSA
jgi:TetR/AcrR family transcriptional regulator, copper-responsive repressor